MHATQTSWSGILKKKTPLALVEGSLVVGWATGGNNLNDMSFCFFLFPDSRRTGHGHPRHTEEERGSL